MAKSETLPLKVLVNHQDGPWTVVHLELGGHFGVGCAKRHPDDASDAQVGAGVATARALADLGKEIRAAALERVSAS